MVEIWPSLISADLLNLQTTMEQLAHHCHGWHIDIMDNHFVPNLTWGAQFVNAIAAKSKKPLWVHLMIDRPDTFLQQLQLPPATYITFHIETTVDINQLIIEINNYGWRPSIAINPDTSIEKAFHYLPLVQQLLIMSVNPGFSGQMLIKETLHKITVAHNELKRRKITIPIALDGGVSRDNIVEIARLGVTQCGIASGIFNTANAAQELDYLQHLLTQKNHI